MMLEVLAGTVSCLSMSGWRDDLSVLDAMLHYPTTVRSSICNTHAIVVR
jgi:hypothetical protein